MGGHDDAKAQVLALGLTRAMGPPQDGHEPHIGRGKKRQGHKPSAQGRQRDDDDVRDAHGLFDDDDVAVFDLEAEAFAVGAGELVEIEAHALVVFALANHEHAIFLGEFGEAT